jgi:hypothetical protein
MCTEGKLERVKLEESLESVREEVLRKEAEIRELMKAVSEKELVIVCTNFFLFFFLNSVFQIIIVTSYISICEEPASHVQFVKIFRLYRDLNLRPTAP